MSVAGTAPICASCRSRTSPRRSATSAPRPRPRPDHGAARPRDEPARGTVRPAPTSGLGGTRHLEDALDRCESGDDREVDTVRPGLRVPRQEQSQAGGVEESHAAEIEHEPRESDRPQLAQLSVDDRQPCRGRDHRSDGHGPRRDPGPPRIGTARDLQRCNVIASPLKLSDREVLAPRWLRRCGRFPVQRGVVNAERGSDLQPSLSAGSGGVNSYVGQQPPAGTWLSFGPP